MPELVDIDGNIEWQHRETGDRLAGIASDGTIIIPSSSSPSVSVSGEARIAFDGTDINVSLGGASYARVLVEGAAISFSTINTTGDVTVGGILTVTGNTDLNGNADVAGTFNVSGDTTLDTLQIGPGITGIGSSTGGMVLTSFAMGSDADGYWILYVDSATGNLLAYNGSVTRTLATA